MAEFIYQVFHRDILTVTGLVLLQYSTFYIKNNTIIKCYGLYKQDNTGIKKGLILGKNQYIRGGTDGTNKTIK